MNFTFYFDESGDQGLSKIDPGFPVFVLCGVLFENDRYPLFDHEFSDLKMALFKKHDVIFHSRDIRKCEKEFCILLDGNTKLSFYDCLNSIIQRASFKVIAATIDKVSYIARYGDVAQDPYDIALSFVVERMVFALEELKLITKSVLIVIEKRGKKEDRKLAEHFDTIRAKGTYFMSKKRIQACNVEIEFRDKKENINGLQLADLIAYPIARSFIEKGCNSSFTIFRDKIYQKNGKLYGLKVFP